MPFRHTLTLLGLLACGLVYGQADLPAHVAVPVASQPPENPPIPVQTRPVALAPVVDTAAILADSKERWDQLSQNQLIRLLWVAWKHEWPRDSLV
ncbi:MAG: hypothetical protein EBZ25_06580, partial [Flavobacteriia bacterium]|nr:hypothetical protein [Flavobacteriia bacterium]